MLARCRACVRCAASKESSARNVLAYRIGAPRCLGAVEGTTMLDGLFRRFLPIIIGALLAVAAYFQAAGLNALLRATLLHAELETAPGRGAASIPMQRSEHATSGAAILARNPFDSVTGPLDVVAPAAVESPDRPCDAGQVMLIV